MVFPKRCLNAAFTQCTWRNGEGGGRDIAATAGVHVAETATAVSAVARVHTITSDFNVATRGLCLQASFHREYPGPHMLWQNVFLQDAFATLSKDGMATSRENCVHLQTLTTAV